LFATWPDRATFLKQACEGDEEMQREIESLLAHENPAEELMEAPVSVAKSSWGYQISSLRSGAAVAPWRCHGMLQRLIVLHLITAFLAAIRVFFRSRVDTSLEVLALRQQVAVLKRKRPRPSLNRLDRFFWTTLRYIWPRWSDALVIVKPETVVGWHRAGFRLYWRWRSRSRGGRPKATSLRTALSWRFDPHQ
jgi:hypothetical protein